MVIDQATKVALGGFITVPTGKEEALEDNFDVGVYGAFRHPLEWGIVATGTVGLVYTERPRWFDDHETILRLSGGAIYPHTENLHFVAEAVFESRYDYMLFSGGLDYRLDQKSHLRGSLGFGVDNGAPDILATLAYFFIF